MCAPNEVSDYCVSVNAKLAARDKLGMRLLDACSGAIIILCIALTEAVVYYLKNKRKEDPTECMPQDTRKRILTYKGLTDLASTFPLLFSYKGHEKVMEQVIHNASSSSEFGEYWCAVSCVSGSSAAINRIPAQIRAALERRASSPDEFSWVHSFLRFSSECIHNMPSVARILYGAHALPPNCETTRPLKHYGRDRFEQALQQTGVHVLCWASTPPDMKRVPVFPPCWQRPEPRPGTEQTQHPCQVAEDEQPLYILIEWDS